MLDRLVCNECMAINNQHQKFDLKILPIKATFVTPVSYCYLIGCAKVREHLYTQIIIWVRTT